VINTTGKSILKFIGWKRTINTCVQLGSFCTGAWHDEWRDQALCWWLLSRFAIVARQGCMQLLCGVPTVASTGDPNFDNGLTLTVDPNCDSRP
jgi:hypothetical protein